MIGKWGGGGSKGRTRKVMRVGTITKNYPPSENNFLSVVVKLDLVLWIEIIWEQFPKDNDE